MVTILLSLLIPFAMADECTPEATQKLGTLMTKVSTASRTVASYKTKYKTDSASKSDIWAFCMNGEARGEFQQVFDEAAPAVNTMEEFGNGQTGPCRESAIRASQDLERNVRDIMARLEECKKNQK